MKRPVTHAPRRPRSRTRAACLAIAFSSLACALAVTAASCAFPEFNFGGASSDSGLSIPDSSPESTAPEAGPVTCAHDCLGGDCVAGACQPVILYADADGGPGGIYVTDLGGVFFTQYYGGHVVSQFPDGGTSFAATGLANPVRVTGSSKGTFATAFASGDAAAAQIVAVSATAGPHPIVLGPEVAGLPIAPWGIVDTGQLIVWTNAIDNGSVMMASQTGATPSVLAVGGHPQEIAANAEFAWFVDAQHSSLFRVPLAIDGGGAVLATPDFVDYVAYAAGHLYTASSFKTSSIGVLDDPASTGASIRELVSRYVRLASIDEPAVHGPHGLAVDDTYIYWLNQPGTGPTGSLVRVRLDGTSPPELLAAHLAQPDEIALTSTAIYWTSFTGTVERLAKP